MNGADRKARPARLKSKARPMQDHHPASPCARCSRCEAPPAPADSGGTLTLWFPLGHTRGKAVAWLRRNGYDTQTDTGTVTTLLPAGALDTLTTGLREVLSGPEQDDTRALLTPGTDAPTLDDCADIVPLPQLARRVGTGWLAEMLAEDRLTSHFQPIVHAEDTSRVFAQEALLRGVDRDGALLPAGKILDAGRDMGALFQLDLAGRRSAIREAGRHGINSHLFINFNPTAIYDPVFCLRSTVQAADDAGLRRERIVFEVIETDQTTDLAHLQRILKYYRDAGFGVALDDMGAGYSSLNLIHQLRPDYIKLDRELISRVDTDPAKATVACKLLEMAQELGIETVAEGVERHEELAWAQAHGATYVQGYLVAKPQSPPVTATPALMRVRAA